MNTNVLKEPQKSVGEAKIVVPPTNNVGVDKLEVSHSSSEVDLNKYMEFVDAVTSTPSKDFSALLERIINLKSSSGADVPHLLTAALGLTAEAGEFTEVVKKIVLQGKPYNEDNIFHLKRELGDILWYVAQACIALDTNLNEILEMNVEKLSARYPEGTFDVYKSENRKVGDL
jgi:NTP pyrophosphatase (non-canonical NTP hydrolase)